MTSRFFSQIAITLLVTSGLYGCKLVDQRTFDSQAGRPPVPLTSLSASAPGQDAPPFINIVEGTPESEYGPVVDHAARVALQHKANVLFIVRARVPSRGEIVQQGETLARMTREELTSIAEHLENAGAKPMQIELRAQASPQVDHSMIRIDLR